MPKVAVIKCENYEPEKVYTSIKKGIDLLGGINCFINNNEHTLLKPNMLFAKKPEEAVTTHPSVFEAVIRIVSEVTNKISYGDSPGIGSPSSRKIFIMPA